MGCEHLLGHHDLRRPGRDGLTPVGDRPIEQPCRERRFDIGIAPLADTPFNRARSNVKLKEYAALGIPWLASPVGPYAGLGTEQGGRLVGDGEWEEALRSLIRHPLRRRRLAEAARSWAATQTIETAAPLWEATFEEAVRRTRGAS